MSAVGHAIPPFVILDAKGLNVEWTKGEIPGKMYGLIAPRDGSIRSSLVVGSLIIS